VAAIARGHLESVRRKLADLTRLEAVLAAAVAGCEDSTAIEDCPVLEMLAE
jgi:MerR family mercuric resistance operon transcriptional regulator